MDKLSYDDIVNTNLKTEKMKRFHRLSDTYNTLSYEESDTYYDIDIYKEFGRYSQKKKQRCQCVII